MGYSGDGGLATSAQINYSSGVATDSAGNVYIGDSQNNCVRKLTVATGIITTVAGNGTRGFSGDGGPATGATLAYPSGLALDSAGNLFIADEDNARIRRVDASTGTITTVAGNGQWAYGGDGGSATSAELSFPSGVVVDTSGNLYIADYFNQRIRKVTASTGIITTIGGNGTEAASGDGGSATAAGIYFPQAIALDAFQNIYVTDPFNDLVRKIDISTGIISTVAGSGVFGYSGDGGPATGAAFENVGGVVLDSIGDLFIADSGNNVVREVNASTGIITTIAGNGGGSFSGDGGAATSAMLNGPDAVALDPNGNLYIIDETNFRVRVVSGAALGDSSQLNGTVSFGTNPFSIADNVQIRLHVSCNSACGQVDWRVDGNEWGTVPLDSVGNYSASTGLPINPIFTVGTHTLTIRYLGNSVYAPANLVNMPFTVLPLGSTQTATVASVSSTSFSIGDNPTASVHVSCNIACGYVSYMIDGNLWGTVALDSGGNYVANASSASSLLTVGSHVLTIQYLGNSTYAPSTSNPVSLTVTGTSSSTLYTYNILSYQANGNVAAFSDSVNGSWSNIIYDNLNRVTAATQSVNGQSIQYLCWTYDSLGNRLSQTVGTNSCNLVSPPPPTSSVLYNSLNQETSTSPTHNVDCFDTVGNYINTVAGSCYDAAGNITAARSVTAPASLMSDGTNQYRYDAEGRLCAVGSSPLTGGVSMVQYIYDAEGRRVAKGTITSLSCDTSSNGFVQTASYILGPSGEQITEMDGNGNWIHTNVYAAGQMIATYKNDALAGQPATPSLHFILADWLATNRVQLTDSGQPEENCQSLSFGDALNCTGATDATEHHFTGKERDTESALDYFGARYYSSNMGRFMSPDWASGTEAIPYAKLDDPQSLNLYAYVNNNPLGFTDADGHSAGNGGADPCFDAANHTCNGDEDNLPARLRNAKNQIAEFDAYSIGQYEMQVAAAAAAAPNNPRRVFLPPNALTCTGMGRQFYAPPQFNLSNVVAAGRAGGKLNIFAMNRAVGHFGTFDYQRAGTPSSFTFYKGLTPVSNMDVGAYLYGAGFTQSQAGTVSNTFADLFSSNAGDPNQAIYRNFGYQLAAGGGSYTCSAVPQ
jgi:RHS repeat-associated protein